MTNEIAAVKNVRAGNAEAYRELVDRYQTGLIIHCENLTKDRDTAEDIAQEAFVKAYYNLSEFDDTRARFSTWLYKIATNLALDYLRKEKRRVDIKQFEELADATMPTELAESEKQEIRDIVAVLEPPKYASVVRGYFWEGKTYKQLAIQHNTTTGSIGVWMSRAKAQLREKLS